MRMPTAIMFAGLLTACSTIDSHHSDGGTTKPTRHHSMSEQCCSQLSELSYLSLKESDNVTLTLSHSSHVVQFSTGNSYAEGVQIPTSSSPIKLTIQSSIEHQSILIPSVLILNDRFQAIDSLDSSAMSYQPRQLLSSAGYSGEMILPERYINGSKPAYLVVFTTKVDTQGDTPIEKPNDMAIQAGNVEANIAHNTDYRIPHSEVGSVVINMDLTRVEQVSEQIERQTEATSYLNEEPESNNQALLSAYHTNIKVAVEQGNFSKALGYVEEAEKLGITGMREQFVSEMKYYADRQ